MKTSISQPITPSGVKTSPANRSENKTIDSILKERKIIITCGTGGVGKTTLSAAIAIRASLLGLKTVVITIDPAKRLANSLGLESLTDQLTDLTPQVAALYQQVKSKEDELPPTYSGTLAAVVPDTRRTFENFVKELAPNPGAAERVMRNPIFQIFAKEFSGTNEYMALERLYALHKRDQIDCIVLDTPPSRNTLAFLDSPKLLSQFFEERLIRWLVLPANKIVSTGMKKAFSILERLTGAGFMTHLYDFASALFEVQVKFASNLKKITALLESPSVGFLVVAAPTPETAHEIHHFIQTVREHQFHFDAVALNRTFSYLKIDSAPKNYENAFTVLHALQEREKIAIEQFKKNKIPICSQIPELARDVHSMEDLFHVAMALSHRPVNSP